jgi:hypothetical protein
MKSLLHAASLALARVVSDLPIQPAALPNPLIQSIISNTNPFQYKTTSFYTKKNVRAAKNKT